MHLFHNKYYIFVDVACEQDRNFSLSKAKTTTIDWLRNVLTIELRLMEEKIGEKIQVQFLKQCCK